MISMQLAPVTLLVFHLNAIHMPGEKKSNMCDLDLGDEVYYYRSTVLTPTNSDRLTFVSRNPNFGTFW